MKAASPRTRIVLRKQSRRRGLTLVEMLVATTVALLLILGMSQVFAMISTTMEDGRSVLHMSNQIRGVLAQLEDDLQGVTVPLRPWAERGAGQGYFEYMEGLGTDTVALPGYNNVSSLFGDVDDKLAFTSRRVETPYLGQVALPGPDGAYGVAGVDDDGNGITDFRVVGGQRIPDLNEAAFPGSDDLVTIESDVAEVVYTVLYEESDPALDAVDQGPGPVLSRPDPGQGEVTLHRRALMIRPDLASGQLMGEFLIPSASSNDLRDASLHIRRYLAKSDLSVRFNNFQEAGGRIRIQVFANSLGDLSQRQNRYAHHPLIVVDNGGTYGSTHTPSSGTNPLAALKAFPHWMEVDPLYQNNNLTSITSMEQRVTYPKRDATTAFEQLSYLHYGDEAGETIALSQLLAFDIRAFDTLAQVRTSPGTDGQWGVQGFDDNSDGNVDNVLEAGAPASDDSEALSVQTPVIQQLMAQNPGMNINQLNTLFPVIGSGAYVDLGYGRHTPAAVAPFLGYYGISPPTAAPMVPFPSQFSTVPAVMPPTYDTWTFFYEKDGVNQNNNTVNLAANGLDDNDNNLIDDGAEANLPLIDEGLNGLDDDGVNGVDDPGERETAPPYAWPLRGIQVRVRVIDPRTRRVRQSSVAIDFIPE